MDFSLIVAHSNFVIGLDNNLPWNYPEDLRYFKNKTINNVVIMGYKTFESIGKPLPNRVNIVISSKHREINKDVILVKSIEEAIDKCNNFFSNKEIFFIGGETIYKQIINFVNKMFITEIKKNYNGNKFFPKYDETMFKEIQREKYDQFDFVIYERI